MSYITSYGRYFPGFKIQGNVLNPLGRKNEHCISYVDEDIITMAFEASSNCLANYTEKIDAVLFATNTPVFKNRYHASYLAGLLNIDENILALDFCQTNRSGTDALLFADKLANSKQYKNILVVASSQSFPQIGKEHETPFGHAAVAIIVSETKGFIEIQNTKSYSISYAEEFVYKNKSIQFDPRFSRTIGFQTCFKSAIADVDTKITSAFIINSTYAKAAIGDLKKLNIDTEKQILPDKLIPSIGYTGAAHALLRLIYAAEQKNKNIALIDYNNGINLIEFSVHNSIVFTPHTFSQIKSYQDYLTVRKSSNYNSIKYQTIDIFSSEMMNEREKEQLLYLNGLECKECKTVYLIKMAQCKKCKCKNFALKKLNNAGVVYTCTKEFYFPSSFAPITMVVIDLDGGGRITVQLTDDMYAEQKNNLQIGSKVKLVLRKMMENNRIPDYFFKCIPTK
jgi:3-hydroxy-3-methylglutaryl CoA synthase